MLPRIISIPRGLQLTPKRLKSLNIRDWLWDKERAIFNKLMLNRKGAIAFD